MSKVILYVRFSVLPDFHMMFHLVHVSPGLKERLQADDWYILFDSCCFLMF